MVLGIGELDETELLVLMLIDNESVLVLLVEETNSGDVEEVAVVFEGNPEGAIVLGLEVDLGLCLWSPFV